MEEAQKQIIDNIETRLKRENVRDFEIFFHMARSTSVEAKNQELDGLKKATDRGVSVRVLIDGKMGFSYTSSLEREAIETLVKNAVGSAKASDPDLAHGFAGKQSKPYPECYIYDPEFREHDENEKVERGMLLEKSALDTDPAVRQVRRATYSESESELVIYNSAGLYGHYRSTAASAVIMVMAVKDGEAEMGWDFDFSRYYSEIDVEKVGKRAAKKALQKLGGRPVETQRSSIILNEETMSELFEVLAPSFYGDNIEKGKSQLAGRLDEKVFSENITIYDDGLLPRGLGSAPFDAEGTPSQKTTLVDHGVLKNYVYDLFWAKRAKSFPTGNATRGSYKIPPSIGNTNYYIEANGTKTLEELTRSLHRGLLVYELIGVHTANPISGEFSLGASGTWIENGEEKFPVKGITISGNILEMFGKIEEIGKDIRFFGSTGAPPALIRDIQISGT